MRHREQLFAKWLTYSVVLVPRPPNPHPPPPQQKKQQKKLVRSGNMCNTEYEAPNAPSRLITQKITGFNGLNKLIRMFFVKELASVA